MGGEVKVALHYIFSDIAFESTENGFRGVVDRRPYWGWCISWQRVLGTFIPMIYNKVNNDQM